jgi:Ca2+/Na+ antiporter
MEKNIVEKMDKAYRRSMVIIAVLGSIEFVIFSVSSLLRADGTFPDKMPELYKIVRWWNFGFMPIFLLAVLYMLYTTRELRRNRQVKEAMNNEMARDITTRSMKVGFMAYMYLLIVAGGVASLLPVYAAALIYIVFLGGVLAMAFAWLYFNREQN